MRASRIEFRVRMLIVAIIILAGFWAPWIASRTAWAGLGPHVSLLEWLALVESRRGADGFSQFSGVQLAIAN